MQTAGNASTCLRKMPMKSNMIPKIMLTTKCKAPKQEKPNLQTCKPTNASKANMQRHQNKKVHKTKTNMQNPARKSFFARSPESHANVIGVPPPPKWMHMGRQFQDAINLEGMASLPLVSKVLRT